MKHYLNSIQNYGGLGLWLKDGAAFLFFIAVIYFLLVFIHCIIGE